MKHIIPIISFILSLFTFCMSALCLILMSLIAAAPQYAAAAAFAVPCLFLSLALTAFSIGINFSALRHKLGLAGFIVSCFSAAVIIATFIIMFAF